MKLNHKVFGEGQVVIILHGLFGSLDNWQSIAKKLAHTGYQVIIADLRNHGRSDHHPDMNFELMAKDVLELMENNTLNTVHLVGHSLGGKVAMQLAKIQPKKLCSLTVVDIAPKAYKGHHNTYFKAMKELGVSALNSRRDADKALQVHVPAFGVRQFLLKNLQRTDSGFKWKFNLDVLYNVYSDLISGIDFFEPVDIPTLFITGALSDYISPADKTDISSYFTNVQFKTIEDAGHWVHADQPWEFVKELEEFLETMSTAACPPKTTGRAGEKT